MTINCKGICEFYKIDMHQYKDKYNKGQKRCTFCGIFLETLQIRCPCCRSVLRTKSRHTKKKIRY